MKARGFLTNARTILGIAVVLTAVVSTARADLFYDLQIDNLYTGGAANYAYYANPYTSAQGTNAWGASGSTLSNAGHTLNIGSGSDLLSNGTVEVEAAMFAMVADQGNQSGGGAGGNYGLGGAGGLYYANAGFNQGAYNIYQTFGGNTTLAGSLSATLFGGPGTNGVAWQTSGQLYSSSRGVQTGFSTHMPNSSNPYWSYETGYSGGATSYWAPSSLQGTPNSSGQATVSGNAVNLGPSSSSGADVTQYVFPNNTIGWTSAGASNFSYTNAAFPYAQGLAVTMTSASYAGVTVTNGAHSPRSTSARCSSTCRRASSAESNSGSVTLNINPVATLGSNNSPTTYWMENGTQMTSGNAGANLDNSTPITINYLPAVSGAPSFALSNTGLSLLTGSAGLLENGVGKLNFALANTGTAPAAAAWVGGAGSNLAFSTSAIGSLSNGSTNNGTLTVQAGGSAGTSTFTLTATDTVRADRHIGRQHHGRLGGGGRCFYPRLYGDLRAEPARARGRRCRL